MKQKLTPHSNLCLSKKETTQHFQISMATLDNWVRTSIPEALVNGLYNISIIQDFVSSQKKLIKRANKKHNYQLEAPKELLKYLNNSQWINAFIEYLKDNEETVSDDIIALYEARLDGIEASDNPLMDIIPSDDFYAYSVAYQLVLSSGEKSKSGSYYTPKNIVIELVEQAIGENKKFLEPCCGVGFFCVEYIKKYKEVFGKLPVNLIFANDLDAYAAKITYLNIKAIGEGQLNETVVTSQDALSLNLEDFDIVLTNPPYGIKNVFKAMKTTEIFSHFIYKTLEKFLKPGGQLVFVLPSSVLSVAKHKEIRKHFLDKYCVDKVSHYGKSFDGVYSDIISLHISKSDGSDNLVLWEAELPKKIKQSLFVKNDYLMTEIDEIDDELISQYEKIPHMLLKDCVFALGIVTGNNSLFLSNEKVEGYERVVSGKEVMPGFIDYARCKYILNEPSKYQQKPPMYLFEQKKIVYKFISKRIVSAVDTTNCLTLNSANFFVLKDCSVSEEYVSALLNSDFLNELYAKKNGNPIKVLKKSLQELPIFIFPKDIQEKIEESYRQQRFDVIEEIIKDQVALYVK